MEVRWWVGCYEACKYVQSIEKKICQYALSITSLPSLQQINGLVHLKTQCSLSNILTTLQRQLKPVNLKF